MGKYNPKFLLVELTAWILYSISKKGGEKVTELIKKKSGESIESYFKRIFKATKMVGMGDFQLITMYQYWKAMNAYIVFFPFVKILD